MSGARELILVRHGQSTANVAHDAAEAAGLDTIDVDVRDADVPLTPLGERQADAFGRWLGAHVRPDAAMQVWTSPYLRARRTAEHALLAAGHRATVRIDERLRDKELGQLDRLTWRGVQRRFPQEWERHQWQGKFYYRAPAGESWADLALRTRSFMTDLPSAPTTVVFTHDAMVFLFRYVCESLDEDALLSLDRLEPIRNCSVTRLISPDDGRTWRIDRFNDCAHLNGLAAPVA